MGKEADCIYYNFTNDYKKLPIKSRASLIETAKNLLRQQKEDSALLVNAHESAILSSKGDAR